VAKSVILVLNDGETYTDLAGCKIVSINTDYLEDGDFKLYRAFDEPEASGVEVVTTFGETEQIED